MPGKGLERQGNEVTSSLLLLLLFQGALLKRLEEAMTLLAFQGQEQQGNESALLSMEQRAQTAQDTNSAILSAQYHDTGEWREREREREVL